MVVLGLIGARCLVRTGELPPLLDELFTRGFLVVETPLHGYTQNPDRCPTAGPDIECRDSVGGGHEKLRCEQYWKKGHDGPRFCAEMDMARLGPSWRRHEFRSNGIADQVAQDPINFRLGGRIEGPATHLVHRLKLTGMASTPQRRGDALIEHPADREMNDVLAEPFLGEPVEPSHGGEVLRELRLLELWIGAA